MPIHYRVAGLSDSTRILNWRNDPSVRRNSRNTTEISIEEHKSWYATRVDGFETEPLFIFSKDGLDIGFTRLDMVDSIQGKFEVTIAVAPIMRGKGYGSLMLEMTIEAARLLPYAYEINATVRVENYSSVRLFEGHGFERISTSTEFVNLRLVF